MEKCDRVRQATDDEYNRAHALWMLDS